MNRFRVIALHKATRIDISGLKARIATVWSGKRMYLDKLERDWVMFSFTTDPDALPSLASTAATQNGGFDPRDIHVGVSRRGAMVVYNSDMKPEVAELDAQLKAEPKLLTPLSGGDVTAKEGQFAGGCVAPCLTMAQSACMRLCCTACVQT